MEVKFSAGGPAWDRLWTVSLTRSGQMLAWLTSGLCHANREIDFQLHPLGDRIELGQWTWGSYGATVSSIAAFAVGASRPTMYLAGAAGFLGCLLDRSEFQL